MNYRFVLALGLIACGNNGAPLADAHKAIDSAKVIDSPTGMQTVVNGDLGGAPFDAQDAVWSTVAASGFDYDAMSTDVTITDFANECSLQTSQTGTPNGRILILMLATTDSAGDSAPITAPGTYTVFSGTPPVSSLLVEAYYEADDATCLKSSTEFATTGTVTVTSAVDPQQASFDLTFPSAHVTGSYHATTCAALDPNATPLGGC